MGARAVPLARPFIHRGSAEDRSPDLRPSPTPGIIAERFSGFWGIRRRGEGLLENIKDETLQALSQTEQSRFPRAARLVAHRARPHAWRVIRDNAHRSHFTAESEIRTAQPAHAAAAATPCLFLPNGARSAEPKPGSEPQGRLFPPLTSLPGTLARNRESLTFCRVCDSSPNYRPAAR
ncbi:hypothetical protein SKAU_G00045800 [Synaphobranchus kaupii]|uniref:Uncharacterized protein n=1 Tax=Synaphobranchus kaupii TaxID=118154 RepID=A0A9Q1G3C4_SYNKA|nr:hypothetical protein SKAU_G00045800 [Synaphobranchus kaupii]